MRLVSAIADAGMCLRRLEVEVTDGVVLPDTGLTLHMLGRSRGMDVRVPMDDFRTGYSLLSYLRQFPFDRLKIDRALVQSVPPDAESVAIARAVITMSDYFWPDGIQEYFVSRPVPPEEFLTFPRACNQQAKSIHSVSQSIAQPTSMRVAPVPNSSRVPPLAGTG